ncbi:MAG TPA: sugar phosphate nucleotidyltransferase [Actinomycetota bacterium]|nr:sugar phosphate nucleotidyltransferase [Actinomycetota bacterium]
MKGVVLAGGLGTRFHPVTKVVNKHLLDVFDEPMVFYPIRTLAAAGIEEITLVTGEEIAQFKKLLGDGSSLGVRITYAYQEGERGIADALSRAESLVSGHPICVILGDNIFQESLAGAAEAFADQGKGAKILLKQVSPEDARRFGVAEVADGKILGIEEKPDAPRSDLVVTGCYFYDDRVFDLIRTLVPSARGELEVTDLNNVYIAERTMTYDVLRGWWTDAGTPASKLKASILVALEKGVTFHR